MNITLFKLFKKISNTMITKQELANLLKINECYLTLNGGLWDIFGCDIFIPKELVKNGELIVFFGYIKGSFFCSFDESIKKYTNLQLSTLKGFPHTIDGDFDCSNNNLTSLEYCPQNITGYFCCNDNNIETLEFCPKNINGVLYCYNNKITSIENIKAKKYYICNNNISYISDDIDVSKISLYKNPYHYFKKINYGIN